MFFFKKKEYKSSPKIMKTAICFNFNFIFIRIQSLIGLKYLYYYPSTFF